MASQAATQLARQIAEDRDGADYYGFDPNLLADLIDGKLAPLRQRIIELGGEVSDEFDPSKPAEPVPRQT